MALILGWWRNCHAWSAAASLGAERAYFDFDMIRTIQQSLRVEFPVIVGAGMTWQLVVIGLMLWSTQSSSSGYEEEAADIFLAD